LGFRPSQIPTLNLPPCVSQQLVPTDHTIINNLIDKDLYVKGEEGYIEELEMMLRRGEKMELEALSHKGVSYVTRFVLEKILAGDYL